MMVERQRCYDVGSNPTIRSDIYGCSSMVVERQRWYSVGSNPTARINVCGHSSVGRATACQAVGRRFEPGCPLQGGVAERLKALPC